MDNIINQINEISSIIITNNIQNQTLLNDFDRVCRIFWNYYNEYNHGQTFPNYFKMNDLDYFELKLCSIKAGLL